MKFYMPQEKGWYYKPADMKPKEKPPIEFFLMMSFILSLFLATLVLIIIK